MYLEFNRYGVTSGVRKLIILVTVFGVFFTVLLFAIVYFVNGTSAGDKFMGALQDSDAREMLLSNHEQL